MRDEEIAATRFIEGWSNTIGAKTIGVGLDHRRRTGWRDAPRNRGIIVPQSRKVDGQYATGCEVALLFGKCIDIVAISNA